MEEIKAPKKERKFLKAMGEVALTLVRELLLNAGKKLINKSGNKRQGLVLAFIILASTFAIAQYPSTGNKQRLGYQTSGDGLVFRGRALDTTALKPSTINNAYHLFDTLNNVLFSYIKTKGGWKFNNSDTVIINNNFTQPVDSLFFNVGVPTNNVDTAKMRWDSDLATVVLGLNDNVANELGFKNFWLVKNQTGSTITKGSLVYANGTLGASGRITVAKFIANGSIDAKYLLGMTAHDLSNGEDGYVISFGKIRKVNTDTFAAGAILYPSPTVAGVWTDIEPIAPNIDMPIGFCINSHVNNGTIAIRVASGYKLSELYDLAISSPIDRASLYYRDGLWRDTTAALLTSDTASLSNRINLKLNIADTASMLAPYFKDADTTSLNLTSRFAAKLNISDTLNMLVPYLRKADTTLMLSKYLRRADTSLLNLTSRFNTKLNISDTSNMLVPYLRKADTTNMLSPYFRDADTSLLNLTSRFAAKQNTLNGTGFVKANGTNISFDNSSYLRTGLADSSYLKLTGGTLTGGLTGTSALFSGNVAIGFPFAYKPFEVLSNANDFVSVGVRPLGTGQFSGIHFGYVEPNTDYRKSAIVFQRTDYTGGFDASGSIHLLNVTQGQGVRSADLRDAKLTISNNGNVGINDTTPSYNLDVSGTLGVTGTVTLSDFIGTGTRMVTANSTGLLSTQAIPTGTVTSVGGTGTVNGISLTGTVTSSGNLTLGGTLSGVSLSSQVTGTLPIANGGTGATTAATARTALGATVRGSNTFILPDLGAISFLRYNADNTVSQRAADGMRTDLGGTTIGQSMFTLTNPSAITFPRFNADNTVSALDAATFRTAIGAGTGTGNGTVTSVTGTAPISVANTTTTPLITIANAGASTTGVVTSSTQTFGGAKTFNGTINATSELAVTGISNLNGGATIGTMATTSTLTHVLGVNSSNAIGEIALSNGIAISGGFLGLDIKTSITVGTDFPNTNAQSSSDITFTLPGVSVGQPVLLGVPDGSANANTNYTAWVSAANTVKIRFNNYSSAAVNPASGSFTISVINL